MTDHWAKVTFDVSSAILGADVVLYDRSRVRLSADQAKQKLFREARTGKFFDTAEMISVLLSKTNTRKQDLVKPAALAEAFHKGVCVGKSKLKMDCTSGSIELCTGATIGDIKRIVFDVELTVRPHKSS